MRKNRLFFYDELFQKNWQIYKYSDDLMIHLNHCKNANFKN